MLNLILKIDCNNFYLFQNSGQYFFFQGQDLLKFHFCIDNLIILAFFLQNLSKLKKNFFFTCFFINYCYFSFLKFTILSKIFYIQHLLQNIKTLKLQGKKFKIFQKLISAILINSLNMLDTSYGFNNLLKEGHKHFSGFEEVVLRNIQACKEISAKIKRSFGPNALKKMVVNHIDKTFVTSDAATILKEMQIAHPAAKMLQMACKMQEEECGDATNFVVTLAGELLNHAENLIRMGLHPSQIVMGYEEASKKALELIEQIKSYEVEDVRNSEQVARALKATIGSKVPNYADFFSELVAKACINSLPDVPTRFDIDNVRVIQILGSSVNDSTFMSGMVVRRAAEGSIDRMAQPRIAVYSCPLDTMYSETKGTVLISNASELLSYSKGEEELAEKFVQKLVNANINVVVCGGTISDIVLHFLDKYKIMTVRILSKFELRRIARAIRATILSKLEAPTPEEVGESDDVCVDEIASEKLVIFKRNTEDCKLSTIILRGSTKNTLEDVQRAIDDGVNVFRSLVREKEFCPGAGSTEIILSTRLEAEAKKLTGLDQYSYSRYAKAFEVFPRILSENAGLNANEFVPKMISANESEPKGLDIVTGEIEPISKLQIHDHRKTKEWAIRLASEATITILKIDQIIIAKPAGGPKMQQNKNWDDE